MAESEGSEQSSLSMPAELAKAPAMLKNGDLRLRVCRYGAMLYSLNDIYMGRSLHLYGEYNEAEVALYRQLLQPGQLVVDAGANIGAHSVVFARGVQPGGRVVAYEPQRAVYQILCANLAINRLRNVDARRAGVGAAAATMTVQAADYDRSGNFGAVQLESADDAAQGAGDSVPVEPIDALALARCDLIKIDVEGMERDVLLGAVRTIERHQPVIYLENNIQEKSPALIQSLFDLGYRLHWHLPRLFNPENFRGHEENVFGNQLNANMLCLPAEDPRRVELDPVESVDSWWKQARPSTATGYTSSDKPQRP